MAVLKCKSCGAPLNVEGNEQVVECIYCGLQQTFPRPDDDFKLQMFNQANDLRRQFDFDGAKSFLQAIISRFPEEPEAYWNVCLCKYGIMYVEDQQTLKQIPTFYRMIPQSILSDADYLKACQYAGAAAWKYEEEAKQIEKLQRKILDLTNTEDPYDIFICYKKTDLDTGALTEDSKIAGQIYMKLIENNYRVFWAERSLPPGCEYEPYIFSALASSKIMLVLSTDKRHFEAPWVKNEWIRYLDMMSRESDKTIVTCYKNISPEDIPANLRSLQALDMSDMLFSSDLLERIQKKLPKNKKDLDTESLFNAFKSFQNANQTNPQQSSQSKEISIDNGVYTGEAIAGKPHGQGTHFLDNGDKYEGSWNVGKMHGQGTFTYHNGDFWTGEWNNGKAWNGNGKYYHTTQAGALTCQEGTLKNGMLSGNGKIYVNGKLSREGSFADGKLNGHGTAYVKGNTCTGEFKNGEPWNAKGVYPLSIMEHAVYNGTWTNGAPNGPGTVEFTNKNEKIDGTFYNGLNGTICWIYDDGRRYEGEMTNGMLSGQGMMMSGDGNLIYRGNYSNNLPNGYGVRFVNEYERYEGEFFNGLFNGQGTYYYQQGYWTGEWYEGKRWNGQGLLVHPNGNTFNGYISNGVATGRGVLQFTDGSRFDGDFYNDNYYNGVVYNSYNQVVAVYANGEVQQEERTFEQRLIDTALGMFKF